MVTVAAFFGPVESLHAAVNSPARATAARARVMRARGTIACRVRLMMPFIELPLT
jgi:hypothetical protein